MLDQNSRYGKFSPNFLTKGVLFLARHTIVGRGALRRAVSHYLRRFHGNTFDLPIWNSFGRLYLDNTSEIYAIIRPDRYNRTELEFLSKALLKNDAVFVDIGANAGLYSLYLAAHSTTPTIILAVEPNPDMAARARFNLCEINPAFKAAGMDIRIVETALGADTGTAQLAVQNFGYGNAQIVTDGGDHTVKMQRFVDVLAEQKIDRIDALKIDVEGYEDQVLMPFFDEAPRTLFPRAIVIEHPGSENWQTDIIQHLKGLGYKEVGKTNSNTLLQLSGG